MEEGKEENGMSKKKKVITSTGVEVREKPLKLRIWNNRGYYVMFLPVLIFLIIMHYWPLLGIRYSFYNYKPVGTPTWVGLENFRNMFKTAAFWTAFKNTLQLSIWKLIITTFSSVVVSIFLNEMGNLFAKKTLQTIIYLPHFMSWAVVASIFSLILSPSSTGLVNGLLRDWGILGEADKNIYFLASKTWWRPIFYIINIWKETGWGTIIFLATLSGINPELYEAADIDGATRMQKIRYVTLPALANTIITVLILNLAKVMNMFESVFVLYNNAVYDVSDVISTYIYRQTFAVALPNYGYSTAVGLFKSLVGCFLVLVCNWASKKTRGRGIV
jgi:putative aldouronate transport system permease protein